MKKEELRERVRLILLILVAIVIVGTYLGLSQETMKFIINLFQSIIISTFLSFIAGSLIEAFSRDMLKKYFLVISIKDEFSVSISFFVIATILLKFILFP